MFLLPIGHDHGAVRRRPWVTFGLMGACLLMLVATHGFGVHGPADRWSEMAWDAIEYWVERPYLEIDARFAELVVGHDGVSHYAEAIPAPALGVVEGEQAELDRLVARARKAYGSNPYTTWGLVPDAFNPFKLITHLFMHAGWLHLLGNMLILYLVGPYIEDVWGRRVYGAFYAAAGIFAALFFIALTPASSVPLVGASGAIAGVMGAFLIRFAHTRIKFFYMIGIFVRGTFDAPAWLMLPLWLAEQLLLGLVTASTGGGVAYWAHVGGFVFGAGVAYGIRRARLEERYFEAGIRKVVEQTVVDNAPLDNALALHAAGDSQAAYEAAVAFARRNPANWDAVLAVWQIALDLGRPQDAASYMVGLVEAELRAGDGEAALLHWDELTAQLPRPPVATATLLRLAQATAERGDELRLRDLIERTVDSAGAQLTTAQALQVARLGRVAAPDRARTALQLALAQPTLDPQSESELVAALKGLRPPGAAAVR